MELKKIFILITAVSLLSCQKDDEIRTLQVKSYHDADEGYHYSPEFFFFYDNNGRVIRVNNTNYYYGTNGKIDYARTHLVGVTQGVESIMREQFYWDEQGRLSRIVMDSLYSKIDGVVKLERDMPRAVFTYIGNENLPSSISYT